MVIPTVYRRALKDNRQDAVRLVGFSEYARSLERFDQLARKTSDDEWAMMDELVQDNPQFTIYIKLYSRLRTAEQSAFVSQRKSDTERKGLDWLIALARLEYGAIIAGFTGPEVGFTSPPLDAPDALAFQELLIESALMHSWSLQDDLTARMKPNQTRGADAPSQSRSSEGSGPRSITPQHVLAYERRVSLTWKMLQAVIQNDTDRGMTDEQHEEILALATGINALRPSIRNNLLNLGEGVRQNNP